MKRDQIVTKPMKKRAAQKLETRQKIRTVAKRLFIEQGFDSATSRQIAQAAGVATGTLFVHFPNKQAMLADILYEDIEYQISEAFRTLPGSGVRAQLSHLASALYAYYLEHLELSRVLIQYTVLDPDASNPFTKQISTFIESVTALIALGQADGEIGSRKAADQMATLFMSAYFFVLTGLLRREILTLEEAILRLEALTDTILS